jgi:hypothetical protein
MSTGPNGLNAGYRGIADIGSTPTRIRFADASINAKQEVEAPDLVSGDWDRDAYAFGKIDVSGSINGPVTESFLQAADSVLGWGAARNDTTGDGGCGELTSNDVKLWYFCGSSRTFTDLLVNSLNFSVAAGEIAQFSVDVIGTSATAFVDESPPHYTTAEKLLTWDKVALSITTGTGDDGGSGSNPGLDIPADTGNLQFSNFEFTITNNVEAVYSLGQPDLFPFDVIPGIRSISGSLSVYNTPDFNGALTFEDYCAGGVHTINFGLSSDCVGAASTVAMKVRFHRIEATLNPGTIISTVGFTGVTHQSGFPWDLSAL